MQKYSSKPREINAIQWKGDWQEIVEWIDGLVENGAYTVLEGIMPSIRKDAAVDVLIVQTKEGRKEADVGDWIIQDPNPTGDRDFYPCTNAVFQARYEEIK